MRSSELREQYQRDNALFPVDMAPSYRRLAIATGSDPDPSSFGIE
jgi:hypothetical protein